MVLSIDQRDLEALIIGEGLGAIESGKSTSDNDHAMGFLHE